MKFLFGIIVGFAICTIGIDVIIKTMRAYGIITNHVIETQFLQERGRIQVPAPAMPKEEPNDKTI